MTSIDIPDGCAVIREYGGTWPSYIVSHAWDRAWYVGVDYGPIQTSRTGAGGANWQIVRLGDELDDLAELDDLPEGCVEVLPDSN